MAFDVGSIEAHLELDRTQFTAELEAARRDGEDFENENFQAELGLNANDFYSGIAQAEAALEALDGRRAVVDIDADRTPFDSNANAVRSTTAAIDGSRATTNFTADDTDYRRGENHVRTSRSLLASLPPVGMIFAAITNPFEIGYSYVRGAISQASNARPTTTFNADTSNAQREIGMMEGAINRATTASQRLSNMLGNDATMMGRFGAAAALAGRAADGLSSAVTRLLTSTSQTATEMNRAGHAASVAATQMSTLSRNSDQVGSTLNRVAQAGQLSSTALDRHGAAANLAGAASGRLAQQASLAAASLLRAGPAADNSASGLQRMSAASNLAGAAQQRLAQQTGLLSTALLRSATGSQGAATGYQRVGAAANLAGVGTGTLAAAAQRTAQALLTNTPASQGAANGFRNVGVASNLAGVSTGALALQARLAAQNLVTAEGPSSRLGSVLAGIMASGSRAASSGMAGLSRYLSATPGPANESNSVLSRLGGVLQGALTTGATTAANGIATLATIFPGVAMSGAQVSAMAARLAPMLGAAGMAAVGLTASLAVIVPIAVLVAGALGAVLAAAVALVASLSILVVSFAALAIGVGLVAAPTAMLVGDMQRLDAAEKAVEQTQRALNAAYASGDAERITQAERAHAIAMNDLAAATAEAKAKGDEYYAALQTLRTAVDNFKSAAETAFTPAATKMAELGAVTLDTATNAMPQLGAASTAAMDALVKGTSEAYDSSTTLQGILDQIPGILESASSAASDFGSAFMSFMEEALPFAQRFMDKVEEIAEKLATWADSEEGRAQIQAFLEAVVPVAEAFFDGVVKIGGQLLVFAEEHGPAAVVAIEAIIAVIEVLIGLLDTALGVVEAVGSALAALDMGGADPIGVGGHYAYGGDAAVPMAHGGNIAAMADGGDLGNAHYVTSRTTGNVGGQDVLYGEALSGDSREYAFPLNGGYRFITEEPGFDAQSFALWADLGQRKGFFGSSEPTSTSTSGGTAGTANTPGAIAASPRPAGPVLNNTTLVAPGSTGQADSSRDIRVENRIKTMETTLAALLREIRDAARDIPDGVKESIDQNLRYGRRTRDSVTAGVSRDAQLAAFEGSI